MEFFRVEWMERTKLLCSCCSSDRLVHEWVRQYSPIFSTRREAEKFYDDLLDHQSGFDGRREIQDMWVYKAGAKEWLRSNCYE